MKILFINGSPNKNGNTANLASILLNGKEYETLNLTDFTIGSYGQTLPYDGLDRVIEKWDLKDPVVFDVTKTTFNDAFAEIRGSIT